VQVEIAAEQALPPIDRDVDARRFGAAAVAR